MTDACAVSVGGDRGRSQRCLWDGATLQEVGRRDLAGIHAVRLLWQHQAQEEDWGFLLIDALNELNDKNRTAML